MSDDPPALVALVLSLPTHNGTVRMRIYRALKALGCGVLRDGVYLLPDSSSARMAFDKQATEVRAAGGAAYLLSVAPTEAETQLLALFDRTADYAKLITHIEAAQKKIRRGDAGAARRSLRQQQRDFHAIASIDYFPGPAQHQAATALAQLEASVAAKLSPDEPRAVSGDIERLALAAYQGRTWATRAQLWVDRVASAWLIRRFIDRKARFVWLSDIKRCPRRALSFDFDGARFTHVGARVTFEVLAASFDLEQDAALTRIAALVHYLDVGGIPVAEAPGFVRMLEGLRARAADDDTFLREASVMLDALYSAYSNPIDEAADVVTLVPNTPRSGRRRQDMKARKRKA